MSCTTSCAARALCGAGPRKGRGTGTAPLPSSRFTNSGTHETVRLAGFGSSRPGAPQSAHSDGRRGRRRHRPGQGYGTDNLQQSFANRKRFLPRLAGAHVRLSVDGLDVFNHALREHRSNRDSATPYSLLQVIKLWYTLPAALRSPDGRHQEATEVRVSRQGAT